LHDPGAPLVHIADHGPRAAGGADRVHHPLHPGETLRTQIWHEGDAVHFRVSAPARGVTVFDRGLVGLDQSTS